MAEQPDRAELIGEHMIRQELATIARSPDDPSARSRAWRNLALYAALMGDHANYLARTAERQPSQLTPPASP